MLHLDPSPEISVALVWRDAGPGLEDAIAGWIQVLDALVTPCELILVDAGAPDDTRERLAAVTREFPDRDLTLVACKEAEPGGALARGFAVARGEVLGALDARFALDPASVLPLWLAIRNGADVALPLGVPGGAFFRRAAGLDLIERLDDGGGLTEAGVIRTAGLLGYEVTRAPCILADRPAGPGPLRAA